MCYISGECICCCIKKIIFGWTAGFFEFALNLQSFFKCEKSGNSACYCSVKIWYLIGNWCMSCWHLHLLLKDLAHIVFLQKKSPLITWLFPKMQSLPQSLLFWNLLNWIFHKVKSDLGASYANKIGIWSSFIWCIMRKPLFTIYLYLLKNHPPHNQAIWDARHILPNWSVHGEKSPAGWSSCFNLGLPRNEVYSSIWHGWH